MYEPTNYFGTGQNRRYFTRAHASLFSAKKANELGEAYERINQRISLVALCGDTDKNICSFKIKRQNREHLVATVGDIQKDKEGDALFHNFLATDRINCFEPKRYPLSYFHYLFHALVSKITVSAKSLAYTDTIEGRYSMRLRTVFLGIVVAAVLSVFAWAGVTNTQTFRTGNDVTITQNERIDSTLFATGSNVDINNDVNGDIFCAGQTVTITGKVSGDIICAGQTITISGTVTGNVRLAGQTVSLDADVAKNATIVGQAVTLRSNGKIGGDLSLAAANGAIYSPVARDAAVAGQSVTIASTIGRDVKGTVQNLTLASGAHIGGNIDYTSANELKKDTNTQVDGKIIRSEPKQEPSNHRSIFAFRLGWFIYSLLALLFLTFMLTLAFPQRMQAATEIDLRSSWRPLLTGFVVDLIAPAVIFMFVVTVIGLPVAILLGLAWLLVLFISIPIAAYYVGRRVLQGYHLPLAIALTGAAILAILISIPILGGLVFLLALWLGSGLILLALKGHWQRPVYDFKAPAVSSGGENE